jgi:hypothetical protein
MYATKLIFRSRSLQALPVLQVLRSYAAQYYETMGISVNLEWCTVTHVHQTVRIVNRCTGTTWILAGFVDMSAQLPPTLRCSADNH